MDCFCGLVDVPGEVGKLEIACENWETHNICGSSGSGGSEVSGDANLVSSSGTTSEELPFTDAPPCSRDSMEDTKKSLSEA